MAVDLIPQAVSIQPDKEKNETEEEEGDAEPYRQHLNGGPGVGRDNDARFHSVHRLSHGRQCSFGLISRAVGVQDLRGEDPS